MSIGRFQLNDGTKEIRFTMLTVIVESQQNDRLERQKNLIVRIVVENTYECLAEIMQNKKVDRGMLPETGEIILKWLSYVGVGLIVLGIILVFWKRKNNKILKQVQEFFTIFLVGKSL